MELRTCVGVRSVNFIGSDGKPVSGVNIYATFFDPNIDGVGTEKLWLRAELLPHITFVPTVGEDFELYYTKYGKVSDIRRLNNVS